MIKNSLILKTIFTLGNGYKKNLKLSQSEVPEPVYTLRHETIQRAMKEQ